MVRATPDVKPGRDGLNVFNLRAYTAPIPSLPDLSFEVEYASERNGDALDSNAWTAQGAYELSDVTLEAEALLSLRVLRGRRSGDAANESVRSAVPRLLRLGHVVAGRDRRRVLPLELEPEVAPGPRARHAERGSRRRADVLQVHARSAAGARHRRSPSKDVAIEIDAYVDWKVNANFTVSVVGAFADPGKAVQQNQRTHQELRLRDGLRRVFVLIGRRAPSGAHIRPE